MAANMSRWERIKQRKGSFLGKREGSCAEPQIQIPRVLKSVVENSDVLLHVLDARDPEGTRSLSAEKYIRSYGTEKKIVLVLSKIDLVPPSVLSSWISYLRREFPCVGVQSYGGSRGSPELLKLLKNYSRLGGMKTRVKVGVFGLPNVGKSSIINLMKRNYSCRTGAKAGTTTGLQEVSLDSNIRLLDSPGVVLMSDCPFVPEESNDQIQFAEKIIRKVGWDQIFETYGFGHVGIEEFLEALGKKRGKISKGGEIDIEASARIVIGDWNTGKIKYYKEPPTETTDVCFVDPNTQPSPLNVQSYL